MVTLYCLISHAEISENGAEHGIISCDREKENTFLIVGTKYRIIGSNGTRCHTTCPIDCICTLGDKTIASNCKTSPVGEATIQYPSKVTYYLNWRDSVIHTIRPHAFLSIGDELIGLDLSNISLQYLQKSAFDGLQGLESLSLEDNYITEIVSGLFKNLRNLDTLVLSGNQLTELANGTFSMLQSLTELYLSNNQLTELAPGTFSMLSNLE